MLRLGLGLGIALALSGCQWGADSPRGFSLPEGNADAGKAAFMRYGCVDCHQVDGLDNSGVASSVLPKPIVLGGSSARVKTYGELVTAIINPSHKLSPRYPVSMTTSGGESKMPNLNDALSVTDLINLVAFLQPKYKVVPYRTSEYRLYQLRTPDQETGSDN
ncbi:cytochrome C [Alteromonas sp. CYL-A6]|uniref:cytochrome C n=1 Tax=Alteromonas nitratireducens TaxID=3390813 RepID=UPI0034B9F663